MIKIVSNKKSAIFLAVILVAGVIGISSPFDAYGETYQSAKCDNINLNINDIGQKQIQQQNQEDSQTSADGQQLIPEKEEESLDVLTGNANGNGNSKSLLNLEKNIVNVCANFGNEDSPVVYGASQEQLPSCEVTVDTITGLGDIPFNIVYDSSSRENVCD